MREYLIKGDVIMSGSHFAYHWSDESRLLNTTEEYEGLISTGEWFDCPQKAFMHRYLFETPLWTVRQASFILCGQSPDPETKSYTDEAQHIFTLIEQDHLIGKLKLKKQDNIRGRPKFTATNSIFIEWALKRGLSMPTGLIDFSSRCNEPPESGQPLAATPAALGRMGAKVTNEPHHAAKAIAQSKAIIIWSDLPHKTKDEVSTAIQSDFQTEKIFNHDEPYAISTISDWIKDVMPADKKKGGRPSKQK